MARRKRTAYRRENRRGIALIAAVLWIVGFASTILGVIQLPNQYGTWALVLAGLLLLISYVFDGL